MIASSHFSESRPIPRRANVHILVEVWFRSLSSWSFQKLETLRLVRALSQIVVDLASLANNRQQHAITGLREGLHPLQSTIEPAGSPFSGGGVRCKPQRSVLDSRIESPDPKMQLPVNRRFRDHMTNHGSYPWLTSFESAKKSLQQRDRAALALPMNLQQ